MKFLLSGGGTGGSVTPLLALYEAIKEHDQSAEFLWVGTKNGPEVVLAKSYEIPFESIPSGKLRRYFSLKNFTDPFRIAAGFAKSFFIIIKFKPDYILTAGSFVSVPLVLSAALLKKKIVVHQQDVLVGLANKIMKSYAFLVTVSLETSLKDFKKAVFTGNPVRKTVLSKSDKAKYAVSSNNLPTVLIMGGGTGSAAINELTRKTVSSLTEFCNIIHITGGRIDGSITSENYRQYEFITDISAVYAASDLIVCRAGMSTLSELSVLGKPAIVIALPDSHQELNAREFAKKNSIVLINQKELTPESFSRAIYLMLNNKGQLQFISNNIKKMMPPDAALKIVSLLYGKKT